MKTISVKKLAELQSKQSVTILDVRTPAEFQSVHASQARNFPLESLDTTKILEQHAESNEQPLYVLCKAGTRAKKACEKLEQAGHQNVIIVDGGTDAWVAADLPRVVGRQTMSLERQVRIAAGSIAFIGSVLAIVTNNVYFAGIPAFIGAGLTFAGVTDTCGMAMVLARMPWNQVSAASAS